MRARADKPPVARCALSLAVGVLTLSVVAGCAGWRVGPMGLDRTDIRTVHVPMFESESFRPELRQRLTEAVCKEIELRTHYRLAPAATADSVLSGRILADRKRVVAENAFDEPRDIEASYLVEISWIDRGGGNLIQRSALPLPSPLVSIGEAVSFIPEGGPSYATAEQQAIDRLARQIVGQMETPW